METNILLNELEWTKEYSDFKESLADTLEEQWNDITSSWIVKEIYSDKSVQYLVWLWLLSMGKDQKNVLIGKILKVVEEKIQGYSTYGGYIRNSKTFFDQAFNFWGQSIVNQIAPWKKFVLADKEYQNIIDLRIQKLYNDYSKTTAKLYTNEIVRWIGEKKTRNEVTNDILKKARSIAEDRVDLISTTESNAMLEYARLETAMMNGMEWKIWHTAEDWLVCSICNDLHWETIDVSDTFSSWVHFPPVHSRCRCYCEYQYDDYSTKSKKKYEFFWMNRKKKYPVGKNKEYLWLGGKSYIGNDSEMDMFIGDFQKKDYLWLSKIELDRIIEIIKKSYKYKWKKYLEASEVVLVIENDYSLNLDDRKFILSKKKSEVSVWIAKLLLTKEGFTQLLKKI